MVEGITHQVQEGIANLFQDRFVEFRLFARDLKLGLFPQLLAQVVDQAWETIEGETHRQHANAHDTFLQFAGIALQLVEPVAQFVQRAHVKALA